MRPFFDACPGVRERIASIAKEDERGGPVEFAEQLDMWRIMATRLPDGERIYAEKLVDLWKHEDYADGQQDFEEACSAPNCMTIGMSGVQRESEAFQLCPRCRCARYCSRECQVWDWKHGGHKHECQPVAGA